MGNRELFPSKSAKELLDAFKQNGSQEPFEEIVRRYAAMVYGVCLRVTGDKHDAEDATQAVFLSLALQAKTAREIKYIGPWLQKVAHRLALDVKKAKTRRKKREEKLAENARFNGNGHHNGNGRAFLGSNGDPNPAEHPGAQELKNIMMEELDKLPAKYRMPLVLHYFGGLSRDEMAAELGCNPSTLGVRVHRGKAMLGSRLAKRGVAMSAIALAVLLEHVVRTATLQPMVSSSAIASSAVSLLASQGSAVAASAKVIALARTAAKAVIYAKIKVAVIAIVAAGSLALTAGGAIATYAELKNLRLPVPMDLGRWIRPLLRGLVPSLHASNTPPAEATELPLDRTQDGPRIAFMQPAPLDVPARDIPIRLPDPRTPNAEKALPAAPTSDPPQLTAIAQSILQPQAPVAPLELTSAEVRQNHPIGESAAASAASDDAEPVDPDRPVLADAGSDLLLGAGGGGSLGGKPQEYILPPNTTLRTDNLVVGDTGPARFQQDGGSVFTRTLSIGRKESGSGTYVLNSGSVTAQREIIGDAGDGAFIQYNGVNVAQDSIIVGKSGSGTYRQVGGETLVQNTRPDADPARDPNGLHLGESAGGTGEYTLSDGSLFADPQLIGKDGDGNLTQTGGKNQTGAVVIAANDGSSGAYDLRDGELIVQPRTDPAARPDAAIKIGGAGKGRFNFGDAAKTGAIYEVGGTASSVVVRGQPRGDGSLIGYGPVNLTGVFVNNGQVAADGHGQERDLDLFSFSNVTSSIENPRWGGTSGWFARRKGRLILPPIPASAGDGTYTWGEDNGDPMIDLVNSVRFDIRDAEQAGDLRVALYSPLRSDVPALPEGHRFIGIWSFDGSELGSIGAVDLQVRYDDAMASDLALEEEVLKLWQYDSSVAAWQRISDSSFSRNTLDHILTGRASGEMTWFAVSAPEPGLGLLLVPAAAALLRRRRRR